MGTPAHIRRVLAVEAAERAGGMGEVRLAFDPALEREVAVKVM